MEASTNEQALLDEFYDLVTFLEDDLGRPLTEDETSEIIEYVFDDDDEDEIDTEIVPTVGDVENAFCPTGEGGGVDATCGGEGGTAQTDYELGRTPNNEAQ